MKICLTLAFADADRVIGYTSGMIELTSAELKVISFNILTGGFEAQGDGAPIVLDIIRGQDAKYEAYRQDPAIAAWSGFKGAGIPKVSEAEGRAFAKRMFAIAYERLGPNGIVGPTLDAGILRPSGEFIWIAQNEPSASA